MRGMLTVFFIVIVVLIVVALAVALKDSGTLSRNANSTNTSTADSIDTSVLKVEGVTDVLNGIPTLESELAQPELDMNIDL